jgi:hypothetical protein
MTFRGLVLISICAISSMAIASTQLPRNFRCVTTLSEVGIVRNPAIVNVNGMKSLDKSSITLDETNGYVITLSIESDAGYVVLLRDKNPNAKVGGDLLGLSRAQTDLGAAHIGLYYVSEKARAIVSCDQD